MQIKNISINGKKLDIETLSGLVKDQKLKVGIATTVLHRINTSRLFLDATAKANKTITYGVNSGFGPMANYILGQDQVLDLQKNLILSHAVGMGNKIPDEFVLAAMTVRLNTLAQGYSGISLELLERLKGFINARVLPVVPEHGAVGTSGDLIQLAHIALAILGKGQVSYKGKIQEVATALKHAGLKSSYQLKAKEGLSLINGTSLMTGVASIVCSRSRSLLSLAIRNGALALEIVRAYDDSYGQQLHGLRPHPGQVTVAGMLRKILKTSKLTRSRQGLHKNVNLGNQVVKIKESVQEVYSMRCIAQILGPIYDSLSSTWKTVEVEMNSVTDNPIVDLADKSFLHGGNFHGDYIAVAMDQLKASLVKMTMLSERRLNFFLNDKVNQFLPPFLNLDTPGLTLGLQGLQFVATSTTANSQTLAYPMNLHSIPTNGDNQDVVSMGTDAALLTSRVAENAYIVLTIELLALCQAVDYLKIHKQLSPKSGEIYNFVRQSFPAITHDRHFQPELQDLTDRLKDWEDLNLIETF